MSSRESRTLVNMLMLYAINTGAATAAISLSVVIVYVCVRTTLASTGLAEIGAKVYANSFIGSLNSRAFLRHKNLNPVCSGFGGSISDIEFTASESPSGSNATPSAGQSVALVEYSGSTACEPAGTPAGQGETVHQTKLQVTTERECDPGTVRT
ncbi:hypothetical protein GSI_09049 [Ganoderma sinense ZZ0214-1]|uniref:DUF6534 domain-containing protein n=1 Tax=Ganoderma sinense ZZ0214-1 TaxID=1077348 RepID=A0A2G8S5F2_9APHY|nr:hypothetical protein GSI_09049 [Ganoderma sinense ZZ0214-1]